LWVDYTLADFDAKAIDGRRKASNGVLGGNYAEEGQTYPMLITRPWGDTPESAVNGQVFLDGNDILWVTSRSQDRDAAAGQPAAPGRWVEAAH
jgi:hypothetical protein